jgi:regulator of sigma E protease
MGNPIPGLSFRWGNTEYAICWLPLGGYVKMATREEEASSSALEGGRVQEPVPEDEVFESKPVWKRMIVILAGVAMNVLFAWLVFSWLAARNGELIDPVTTVGGVVTDTLPPGAEELATIQPGDRIIAINGKPVASWNDVEQGIEQAAGDSLVLQLAGGRAVTLRIHHTALGDRLRALTAIGPQHPIVIGQVESGRPGARAGVMPGDTLVSINGEPATFNARVLWQIRSSPGRPLHIVVGRADGRHELVVTPDSLRERGHVVGKVGLGLGPAVEYQRRPYHGVQALIAGWRATLNASTQIVRVVQGLLSARISSREVGGPILIAQMAGDAAKLGLDAFLTIMAFISVNLAVLNLLPIPVLDGGQFLFLLAEGVLRRPLSLRLRERLTLVGLFLIVCLMVLAFSNDIRRLLGV